MRIIGVDFHVRQQTIAMFDTETKELVKKTLKHEGEQVREFYSALPRPVQVGIEATGSMYWFLDLLEELRIDRQVGHPAQSARPSHASRSSMGAMRCCSCTSRSKTASHRFGCPRENCEICTCCCGTAISGWRMRTRVQNALQAIAVSHGLRRGPSLWSQTGQHAIASLPLAPHAAHRRNELQTLYCTLSTKIDELDQRVKDHALQRSGAKLLMSHPGVGPVTALATDAFLGDPSRFADSKTLTSYIGIIPSEYSTGGRQRLGGLSKQGNPLRRFRWCETGMHAVRRDPELKRFYRSKLHQKGLGKVRVAVARKLGFRLWIRLRDQIDYQDL